MERGCHLRYPCSPKECQMTKEEKLEERIKKYEEDKKELNTKIRKAKSDLRWLKIKRLTQRNNKMKSPLRRGKKLLRWE